MQTAQMFEIDQQVTSPSWNTLETTVGFNDNEIISSIMRLYNDGKPFDLDTCYNVGGFWAGLPQPLIKFDIQPLQPDIQKADSRSLPIDADSIKSIMYDPPFLLQSGPESKIKKRFSCFPNLQSMFDCYFDTMTEFMRVLRPAGFFVFKCQDMVSSGKQVLSHVEIINMARDIGFYCRDLFIRVNQNVMFSPNMINQQHARKTHCYYLVFTKKTKNVYKWTSHTNKD